MTEPDRDAYAMTGLLDTLCPDCGAAPREWCVDDDGSGVRRIPCVGRYLAAVRAIRGANAEHPDLRGALRDWEEQRPPKDIVPRQVPDDLTPILTGPGLAYTFHEITDDGVTRTEGAAYIARPIMPKTEKGQQK